MSFSKISKWKKLYSLNNGNQYFMHHGRRWHLSEFMVLDKKYNSQWDGSMQLSNTGGMLLKFSPCGEAIKICYVN